MKLTVTINGSSETQDIRPGELLVQYLRRTGRYSVKRGCEDGNCGTCVVEMDGQAVNSCLMLAAQAEGKEIWTCEGIGNPRAPHPVQQAFVDQAAVQCGFCTPGLIMSTKVLLDHNPRPTDTEIKRALDGNLCRCTGYVKIMDAVHSVIEQTEATR